MIFTTSLFHILLTNSNKNHETISGAGKSTLLDILGGRKSHGNISGKMSIFGKCIDDVKKASKSIRTRTAFVPQELAFFPMQTPEEAVRFVIQLKHGKNEHQEAQVRSILQDVGLDNDDLYSRPIGGELIGGLNVRGLSGGEKVRNTKFISTYSQKRSLYVGISFCLTYLLLFPCSSIKRNVLPWHVRWRKNPT